MSERAQTLASALVDFARLYPGLADLPRLYLSLEDLAARVREQARQAEHVGGWLRAEELHALHGDFKRTLTDLGRALGYQEEPDGAKSWRSETLTQGCFWPGCNGS
jgi:hypothetical protein